MTLARVGDVFHLRLPGDRYERDVEVVAVAPGGAYFHTTGSRQPLELGAVYVPWESLIRELKRGSKR